MIVSDAFSPAYASNCAKPCSQQLTFKVWIARPVKQNLSRFLVESLARRTDTDCGRKIAGKVQVPRSRARAQNKIVGGAVCEV
jgi:hypothetical protein